MPRPRNHPDIDKLAEELFEIEKTLIKKLSELSDPQARWRTASALHEITHLRMSCFTDNEDGV
jgi:hypothetical protein